MWDFCSLKWVLTKFKMHVWRSTRTIAWDVSNVSMQLLSPRGEPGVRARFWPPFIKLLFWDTLKGNTNVNLRGADGGKFRRKTARHPGDLSPGSGDCAKSLRWDKSQDKWKPLSAVGKKKGKDQPSWQHSSRGRPSISWRLREALSRSEKKKRKGQQTAESSSTLKILWTHCKLGLEYFF